MKSQIIKIIILFSFSFLFITKLQSQERFVWHPNHQEIISSNSIQIQIGMSPKTWEWHQAGVRFKIRDENGQWSEWQDRNAHWTYNQAGIGGNTDEIWELRLDNFKVNQEIEYAVWVDFGNNNRLWDNNNNQNYQSRFEDRTGPLFYTPFGAAHLNEGRDNPPSTLIRRYLNNPIYAWTEVIISGFHLKDELSNISENYLVYSTDNWQSQNKILAHSVKGKIYNGHGQWNDSSHYQYIMGHFDPGTHVEFYFVAIDDYGNRSYLPGNFENFSFDVVEAEERDFYLQAIKKPSINSQSYIVKYITQSDISSINLRLIKHLDGQEIVFSDIEADLVETRENYKFWQFKCHQSYDLFHAEFEKEDGSQVWDQIKIPKDYDHPDDLISYSQGRSPAIVEARPLAHQWTGHIYHWPENGALGSNDQLWVNLETYPIGTVSYVKLNYSINDIEQEPKFFYWGGTKKNNDWWHVNLGPFPEGTTIQYDIELLTGNFVEIIYDNEFQEIRVECNHGEDECNPAENIIDEGLKIIFADVDQGNAALILGHEKNLLIDGGRYERHSDRLENLLMENNIEELHYLVSTHYDADHIGGLNYLLWDTSNNCEPSTYFPQEAIIDLELRDNNSQTAIKYENCRNNNIDLLNEGHVAIGLPDTTPELFDENGLFVGYGIDLGGGYQAQIVSGNGYVIGSDQRIQNENQLTSNEKSIAVLIVGPHNFEALITGDLIGQAFGAANEDALLEEALGLQLNLDIEVLGVGHHGASNASNPEFLAQINPDVSIISVGANGHGHPTCQTLEALNEVNQYTFQTGLGEQEDDDNCPHLVQDSLVAEGSIGVDVLNGNYRITSSGRSNSLLGEFTLDIQCHVDLACL